MFDFSSLVKEEERLALDGGRRARRRALSWFPVVTHSSHRQPRLLASIAFLSATVFTFFVALRIVLAGVQNLLVSSGNPQTWPVTSPTAAAADWTTYPPASPADTLHNMTICVTGSAGKIGSALVPYLLQNGHRVVGIDKHTPSGEDSLLKTLNDKADKRYNFITADATDYYALLHAFRGCNALVHLAGIGNPGDYVFETHNQNMVASWNAMRAAAEAGIKRISLASSVNAIGMFWGNVIDIDYFPIDEAHPTRPSDPYSLSKQLLEFQADSIVRQFPQLRVASLRIAGVHSESATRLERTENDARKDLWCWVLMHDTIDALMRGVTSGTWVGHERMFVVAKSTTDETVLTVDLLAKWWGSVPRRKRFHGSEGLFDCSKAEALLGWRATL